MEKAEKRSFIIYLAVAYGVAWVLQYIVACLGDDPVLQQGLMVVVMLIPALALLVAKGSLGRRAGICWRVELKKNWRSFLLAWFLPPVLTAAGAALYFLICPDQFGLDFAYLADGYRAAGIAVENGTVEGVPLSSLALMGVLQAVTYAPFINMIPALGEELGWRGYMTPRFRELLGDIPGLLVSGALWGLWHAPLIALIGYEYGTGYFGAPVTGILLFCVFGAVIGTLLTLLYERTGSIWAPALAHGAINASAALGFLFCRTMPTEYLLGPALCGLIPMLAPGALTAVLLLRRSRKKQ